MSEEIVFTLGDDWDPRLRACPCPTFAIPSAFIQEDRDPKGQPVAISLLNIDNGPASLPEGNFLELTFSMDRYRVESELSPRLGISYCD
jgi:hypothetical protein